MLLTVATATNYISGEVKTWKTYQYGRFSTRIWSPSNYGTVASFFTYWDGPNWFDGGWNEIDVELVSSMAMYNTSPFSTNIIYGSGTNYHMQDQAYDTMTGGLDNWHDYTIEWTPEYIKWTMDGVVKRTSYAGSASVNFTNKAQKLMMNFWTPTFSPWGDGRSNKNMPWYALYDFV